MCFTRAARLFEHLMAIPPRSAFETGEPRVPVPTLQAMLHLMFLLGHWPWGLLPLSVFASVAVLKPKEEKSWISAFMTGAIVLGFLQQLILHI
jgi:hypothetical protein